MKIIEGKEYITIKEAAQLLHVNPRTLRTWNKKGKFIPYIDPMNNYRYYCKDDLIELQNLFKKSKESWKKK